MPDDKQQVGQPDRDRVSASQEHEVAYLAQRHGLSRDVVIDVIQRYGPMRKDVEEQLRNLQKSSSSH